MKNKYKWNTSKNAFLTFKLLFLDGEKEIKQISLALGINRTTILQHLEIYKKQGLICERKDVRKKIYSINKETLATMLKIKVTKELNDTIKYCQTFQDLIDNYKGMKYKIPKDRRGDIELTAEAYQDIIKKIPGEILNMIWKDVVIPLEKKNEKLSRENKALQKRIKKIEHN